MAKAIVVYESKYGNTKLVAETIVEGMNQVTYVELEITYLIFRNIGNNKITLC